MQILLRTSFYRVSSKDSKASTAHCVLPHSYLYTSYPSKMSIILETQSPLISGHTLPLSVVRMSHKCNFCSTTLFVPLYFPLYSWLDSFSAAINLYTIKGLGEHINWKMDYITLRASLSLPPVSRNGISPDLSFLTSQRIFPLDFWQHLVFRLQCHALLFSFFSLLTQKCVDEPWTPSEVGGKGTANPEKPKVENSRKLHRQ